MPLHHLSLRVDVTTRPGILDEQGVIFGVQDVIFGVWSVIFGVQDVIVSAMSCAIRGRTAPGGVERYERAAKHLVQTPKMTSRTLRTMYIFTI